MALYHNLELNGPKDYNLKLRLLLYLHDLYILIGKRAYISQFRVKWPKRLQPKKKALHIT